MTPDPATNKPLPVQRAFVVQLRHGGSYAGATGWASRACIIGAGHPFPHAGGAAGLHGAGARRPGHRSGGDPVGYALAPPLYGAAAA